MGRLSRKIERRMFRRVLSPSLESSSPPDSPEKKGAFLQRITQMVISDSDATDDQHMAKPVEHESTADYDSNDEGIDLYSIQDKIDSGQLKSAKDLEDFISAVHTSSEPVPETLIDQNLLNIMRVQKSSSLDAKLVGKSRSNLKVSSLFGFLVRC